MIRTRGTAMSAARPTPNAMARTSTPTRLMLSSPITTGLGPPSSTCANQGPIRALASRRPTSKAPRTTSAARVKRAGLEDIGARSPAAWEPVSRLSAMAGAFHTGTEGEPVSPSGASARSPLSVRGTSSFAATRSRLVTFASSSCREPNRQKTGPCAHLWIRVGQELIHKFDARGVRVRVLVVHGRG